MANKIKIDYSQFKASGVYILEFDNSQNVLMTSQTLRLVVGFSNKGPFNTPVYIPDANTMISVFGNIDKSLETKGSFFHRSILTCLNTGPVFALNLLKLNDDIDSGNADTVDYKSFSVDTENANGVANNVLYSTFYNKERFWYADPDYFLATLKIADKGRLLSLTNLGKTPMSVIIRKSSDSIYPLKGYDIFAIDWYGADKLPEYIHPYDYISDYFIDVISVAGDWTNYDALSVDIKWSPYFTKNGFIKNKIDAFLSHPEVSTISRTSGCIIPDFTDLTGNNRYIQTLINNDSPITGLFCAIDEKAFDSLQNNAYTIDLVGHHLIDELTSGRDLVESKINFLSYEKALTADYVYEKNSNEIINGATGAIESNNIRVGNLLQITGIVGGHGIQSDLFNSVINVNYGTLTTTSAMTLNVKKELKDYLSYKKEPYIIGTIFGIGLKSDSILDKFNDNDLIKLKIVSFKEIGGQIQITWTHPLLNSIYSNNGITIRPTTSLTTNDPEFILNPNSLQFGVSDLIENDNNELVGYIDSILYQNIILDNIKDRDTIWTSADGDSVQYIKTRTEVDRDNFNYAIVSTYNEQSLSTQTNIINFGDSYKSNNIGSKIGGNLINIVSSEGNINEFITTTKIDPYSFYIDTTITGILSVGDLIVSSDLDLIEDEQGNHQNRLTKIKTISQTGTPNKIKVTCHRPVLYYAGNQIQKFKSIEEFTDSFNFTYLPGFKMKTTHRPDGSDAKVTEILNVMYETNIAKSLASKDIISFRYIIDTFDGQILPNSKYQLSQLAKMRMQSLAIINAPSMNRFKNSIEPKFTDIPTTINPYPSLNTSYIVSGGNLALNPSYTFSLPSEELGSKFCAFYGPFITVRENNRNINVPPAAMVSNNFVRKFTNGEPYSLVAGQKRGVLFGGGSIVGLEYDFTQEDLENLEPYGINPIIKKKGIGCVISGNQTAYQQVNSALNLVHVRDILISLENDVTTILSNYLFDFNEDSTRLEIKTLVDNYLDGVRSAGGIYKYESKMDASNNTPEIIDQNIGIIDIIIEPVRGISKFIGRITVTRTGGISSGGFIQFS